MRLRVPLRFAALVVALAPGCVLSQQQLAPTTTVLDRYDFTRPTARHALPGRLDEISGLAVSPDGRLFGHDDERATVHEINPVTGDVGKRFSAGDPPIRGDFEGLAIVGERFFLVTSEGMLYEMREAEDRTAAPHRVSDLRLGGGCEIEGLDYDAVDDVLLLACKVMRPDPGAIVIHRVPLDPARGELPPILVARADLERHGVESDFEPSAIAVDPTGSLVMVSAPLESLVEVDRQGRVLAGLRLSRVWHPQPEGLAYGPDGTLYIADEQNGRDAHVTAYAPRARELRRP